MDKRGNTTVKFINGLTPSEKEYTVAMADKITIRIFPDGRKVLLYLYTSPETGQRRKYRLGEWGKITLADANKRLKAAERFVEKKIDPLEEERREREQRERERRRTTVAGLAQTFIEEYSKPRKKTWKEDERILAAYVVPRWGKIPVAEIQPADVRAFVKDVATENGGAQSTRALACVRKMFSWAQEELILEDNPAAGVKAVVKDKRRERVLTPAEIRGFWNGVQEPQIPEGISRALRFALVTGMRVGEIIAARWVDVEEGRWLNVLQTKSDRSHKVYLSGLALEIMGEAPEDEEEKKNLIFTKPDGAPILNYDVSKYVRRHLKEWGAVSPWTPHDLRRSCVTMMSEAGVDRLILGKVLNHADQSTTAIYDRAGYWNDMRRAWELWSRRLTGILEGKAAGRVVEFPGGKGSNRGMIT